MLAYLTADQPGVGGQIKREPADFVVEEIPLYLPSGQGQHLYVTLEKEGVSTFSAIKIIARTLNISPKAIGYAGLKDAQAVTRQTLSLDNVEPSSLANLTSPHLKILHVSRHKNKLKIGHLAGNRFVIKIRQVEESQLDTAKAILETLSQKGVPNFFGEQRFGNRNTTHLLGESLIRADIPEFVATYLGRPQAHEPEPSQTARALVEQGQWEQALQNWPKPLADERRVLAAIVQEAGRFDTVEKALDKKLKNFFVSAFQSAMFNELLSQRLNTLDQLEAGDIAYLHRNGAAFLVEDVAAEQPRADQFEISPSGPLFGPKLLMAEGAVGQREQACLTQRGLILQNFKRPGLKLRGGRRPFRIQLKNPQIWWESGITISFDLPPGAYATIVLAEIMKIKKG